MTAKEKRKARQCVRIQGINETLGAVVPAGYGYEDEQTRATMLALKHITRLVYVAGRISRPLPPTV